MKAAKISIEELAYLADHAKWEYERNSWTSCVLVYIKDDELVIEQPSGYAECNSYYRNFPLTETED